MRGPYYDKWPAGQGFRAQAIFLIDMVARLVVGLMVMWFLLFILLWAFGDVSPWPHHR
jgi:tetrahydromethanopterin S-methyltransferase subunit B